MPYSSASSLSDLPFGLCRKRRPALSFSLETEEPAGEEKAISDLPAVLTVPAAEPIMPLHHPEAVFKG